jgi:hypothetical protein
LAILYHIKVVFEDTVSTLLPPNLSPGTHFFQKLIAMNMHNHMVDLSGPSQEISPLNYFIVIVHIFPDEDALNTFCSKLAMTESEKLSMKEWTELNKIKITYHTYDLPESTVPAPALFG